MDSRSFWFGAAVALALLLFWRERKQIENALGLEGFRHGAGADGGGAGLGGPGGSCCEKCAGDTAILPISPVEAPLAPNYSAPAHYVIGSVAQPSRINNYVNPLDSVRRFF